MTAQGDGMVLHPRAGCCLAMESHHFGITAKGFPMTQHATIAGHVTYTPGDGAPLTIPKGPVELDASKDSMTLSWTADNEAAGSAAIPKDQFNQYVRDGKIRLAD